MNVLIVDNEVIPAVLYGGTQRVIWDLGKELFKMGHNVTYLVKRGSVCEFALIIPIDENKDLIAQIPANIDVIHFNFTPSNIDTLKLPYVITVHGNSNDLKELNLNTVFVSKNHANRYGSDCYIHNGLDWGSYMQPNFSLKRNYFHFLGNASWRVKNVQGAIDVVKDLKKEKLKVLGGYRLNLKMGLRLTLSHRVDFYGMVGGEMKDNLINGSKGLVFPVRWHEPFGLAIIESLYFGCPIFGTPYGSLPEIVKQDFGYLSSRKHELVEAIQSVNGYSKKRCHEYAFEEFNSKKMAVSYLEKYERVLSRNTLNEVPPKLKELQKVKLLERVGELRKVESRANFVVTKRQSNDQTVAPTDRPSMGRNFALVRPKTQA